MARERSSRRETRRTVLRTTAGSLAAGPVLGAAAPAALQAVSGGLTGAGAAVSASAASAGVAAPAALAAAAASGGLERLTQGAMQVLALAQQEAQRFNHNYIGTEHLLLGLTRHEDGGTRALLGGLGVELERVRGAVGHIIGRGDRMVTGDISLTPRSKKAVQLAIDEAARLGHAEVTEQHLLLGLVKEGNGIAAGVLRSLGADTTTISYRILGPALEERLGNSAPTPPPAASSH